MGECQRVTRERLAGADEWHLEVQPRVGVTVKEEALFFAVRLVEDDEAARRARRFYLWIAGRNRHRFGEARPLAQITRGVEVGHPRGVVRVGGAFFVTEIEEAVLLVEVGFVEEHEQPTKDIVVFDLLVVSDPTVAQALQNETDAVHLAVSPRGAAKGPAESVRADEVGHHLDVFFPVGAQGRELAITHAAVGVELQRRADEHEAHHTVKIVIATETLGGVIEETGRASLVDALAHPLDQP